MSLNLQRTDYTYPFATTGLNDNDSFLFLILKSLDLDMN